MKKKALSMFVFFAGLWGGVAQAADPQPSTDATAKLTVSGDNTTLTISGKGDLTSYTEVSSTAAFTSQGGTNVGTTNNQYNIGAVGANTIYDNTTTYYGWYYSDINASTDASITNYLENATVTRTWTEKAISDLYYTADYGSTFSKVTAETPFNTTANWQDGVEYTYYSTTNSKEGYLKKSDFTNVYYTESISGDNVTFNNSAVNILYVYDSESKTYKSVSQGSTYNAETTYYVKSFIQISEAQMFEMGYLEYPTQHLKDMLTTKLASGNTFTTILFANEDAANAMKIDNDIVAAILYPNNAANTTVQTLDLGAATLPGLSTSTFSNENKSGSLTLTAITLPLTEAANGAVCVPSLIVENLKTTLKTVTVPAGYTKIGNNAFDYLNNITAFYLPSTITAIGENAFRSTTVAAWNLPENLESIGDGAFRDNEKLTSVSFPKTLKTIGKSAFANCKSYHSIALNDGLETIGNSAFYLVTGDFKQQTVLEIPSSVKYIGPAAFNSRLYTDVYYYGQTAPISPIGKSTENSDLTMAAYSSKILFGNDGFDKTVSVSTAGDISKGYASHANYINGQNYFAMLHYPTGLETAAAKTFTDVTRTYLTYTGEGDFPTEGSDDSKYTVGQEEEKFTYEGHTYGDAKTVTWGYKDIYLGAQYVWPSQSQFSRSYVLNSLGYEWNGKDTYAPSLDEDIIKMIKADVPSLADETDENIEKVAYAGTRQFTLVASDVKDNDETGSFDTGLKSGERWWTLCVPCDVTKAEVDEVFGENTQLCLFSKAIRKTSESEGNEIHLFFQNDTYKNKYTRNSDGSWTKDETAEIDDNTVVLYAHTPYMIYPTKNPTDGSSYILNNVTKKSGEVQPTIIASISAEGAEASEDATKYMFIGNYNSTAKIPQYSYVYGRKKTATDDGTQSKFWFYTGTATAWGANKCIVERADYDNNSEEFDSFFKGSTNGAKEFSVFGESNDATGIEKVVFHYGDNAASAPVYNLNGQRVGNSAAKGIYIQNGKKFIVK